jgi:hypothetical protein
MLAKPARCLQTRNRWPMAFVARHMSFAFQRLITPDGQLKGEPQFVM